MENLVEVAQITAMVRPLPLLEKKVIVDTLLAREVRFNTPRTTSGALARPSATTGAVARQVTAWAQQIRIPSFSVEGFGKAIDLPPLNPDSLRTTQQARAIVQLSDSARRVWETDARTLDPGPKIDSAKALVERLRTLDVRALGLDGVRSTVQTSQATLKGLTSTLDQVRKLQRGVDSGVARLRSGVSGLDEARRGDYTWARGLLKLPSLEEADISPALFGRTALDRLQTLLYWAQLVEQYMPAGLKPHAHDGPRRMRMAGTTVAFPRARGLPQFLLRFASLDLTLGGTGATAGDYVARLVGPHHRARAVRSPVRVPGAAERWARREPKNVRVAGQVDHIKTPTRDSVEAFVAGVALPTVELPPVQARAVLGAGTTEVSLVRRGSEILARWQVRSTNVAWQRLADSGAAPAGAARDVEDLVWRAVSGVKDVEVEGRIRGALTKPSFAVSSNLGTELARRLRQEIGAKVEQAERRVRAQVDSLVDKQVAAARQRVSAVQEEVQARLAKQQSELTAVRAELDKQLKELTRKAALPRLPFPGKP